jgi:UDP-N-acetylmuramoyl-L-alanyl-D-glutamate--2,6-diaminopimelate ligase
MLELHTPMDAARWLRSRVTGTLCSDSRKLQVGDGFMAWPGAKNDARQQVVSALASGAKACLVEQSGVEHYAFDGADIATYAQLKWASGTIAAAYFEHPSEQLDVLAVTGTNGKTSTAWWLAQALSNLKLVTPIACGLVGTLGIGHPPAHAAVHNALADDALADVLATGLTTPDPVLLQATFRRFVDAHVKACVVEASSVGIDQRRLEGTHIRCAVFTNFTQDHLDYHGTMEAYWQAKAKLFSWPGLQSAVINIDDAQGAQLAASLDSKLLDVWSVSCTGAARLQARDISYDAQGLRFTLVEDVPGHGPSAGHLMQTKMIGSYNVANLLGVMAAMRSIGVPLTAVVASCQDLLPVPGRMQCLGSPGQPLVAVDYAHTPDALANALLALRSLADQRGGQLCCIFGCGGDRDSVKRPLMGALAASHADRVVVTSDNPRSEQPDAIINQILLGMSGYAALTVESNRALAIAQALTQAQASDVLLIAGKGHENYQEIAGQRLPFSDVDQVRRALDVWVAPERLQEQAL